MKIFISHASEDKDEIARPLANALKKIGYDVWFDEYSLKLGDSLSQEINKGLSNCDYGIVILSEAFFQKKWTMKELSGLVAKESGNSKKVILPIWHGVDAAFIAEHSPTLADKKAVSTSDGIDIVVAEIRKVAREPRKKQKRTSSRLKPVFHIGEYLTKQKNITREQIFSIVYQHLCTSIYADNFYIALYDKGTSYIHFPLSIVDGNNINISSRPFGSGRTEYIIRNEEPLLIETRDDSIEWYSRPGNTEYIGEPFASWLGVPIIFQDDVLGVIAAYHAYEDYIFDQQDLRFLEVIAQQVATYLKIVSTES